MGSSPGVRSHQIAGLHTHPLSILPPTPSPPLALSFARLKAPSKGFNMWEFRVCVVTSTRAPPSRHWRPPAVAVANGLSSPSRSIALGWARFRILGFDSCTTASPAVLLAAVAAGRFLLSPSLTRRSC